MPLTQETESNKRPTVRQLSNAYLQLDSVIPGNERPFDGRLAAHSKLVSELKITSGLVECPEKPFNEWSPEDIETFVKYLESDVLPPMELAIEVIHHYLKEDGMQDEKAYNVYSNLFFFFDLLRLGYFSRIKKGETKSSLIADCETLAKLIAAFCTSLYGINEEIINLGGHQTAGQFPRTVLLRISEETRNFQKSLQLSLLTPIEPTIT